MILAPTQKLQDQENDGNTSSRQQHSDKPRGTRTRLRHSPEQQHSEPLPHGRRRHEHGGGEIGSRQPQRLALPDSALQASLAALSAIAGYAALRAGITLFHHARRGQLRQLLFDVSPALSQVTTDYWLDFGSLLGIHRDDDLILHDNDIDLVVLEPNWQELHEQLQGRLPQYGVKLEVPSEDPDSCFMRVYCTLGFADIFGATHL